MFTYAEEGRLHWSQSGCVNRQGVSGKFQISSKVATDHTGETTDRVALRTNPESVPNQERFSKNSLNWASEISEGLPCYSTIALVE